MTCIEISEDLNNDNNDDDGLNIDIQYWFDDESQNTYEDKD